MNIFHDNQCCFHSFSMPNTQEQSLPNMFEPDEALTLGNLFKELYMSYCGFSNFSLQPQNRRQELLLNVQIYAFVVHEINLYLDMHPDDQRMLQLYKQFTERQKQAVLEFENEFGPLQVEESSCQIPFEWVQGPWPWEYQK